MANFEFIAWFWLVPVIYTSIFLIRWALTIFAVLSEKLSKYDINDKNSKTVHYTILQPILSGDPLLKKTLEKNLLEHPDAIFHWLVDLDDPEGKEICKDLQSLYKEASIQILTFPPCPDRTNPKLFKIHHARQSIRTDWVIVLDDDTFLPRKTARALICRSGFNGVVTGLPVYLHQGDFWSALLSQFPANQGAMTYLPPVPLGKAISINGMCYAISKKTLESMDFFRNQINHLTDDLAVAKAIKSAGLPILQLSEVQYIRTSLSGPVAYFRQMHRWFVFAILLIKEEKFSMKILILILQAVGPFLLMLYPVILFLEPAWDLFLLAVFSLLIRGTGLVLIQFALTRKIQFLPFLSVLSEMLQTVHMIHALISRQIIWRKRKYRVERNDRFFELS